RRCRGSRVSVPLPTIGFVGLTHLGICSAAAAAARGFPTIGYDEDGDLVARLSGGGLPIAEPGLVELIDRHRQRVTVSSVVGALGRCDIVYAAQDVPTDEAGESDLAPVRALIERTAQALNPQGLLVVLCQVPPGFTRALPIAPARRYYQVETL